MGNPISFQKEKKIKKKWAIPITPKGEVLATYIRNSSSCTFASLLNGTTHSSPACSRKKKETEMCLLYNLSV